MKPEERPEYMKKYRKTYPSKRIWLTVSQAQFNQLSAAAKPNEKLPAATLRLALERLQEAPVVPSINEETAQEVSRLWRNVANNMNQIAYNMNAARQIFGPGGNLEEPAQTFARMFEMFAELERRTSEKLRGVGDAP